MGSRLRHVLQPGYSCLLQPGEPAISTCAAVLSLILKGQPGHLSPNASLAGGFARVVQERHLHIPSDASLASSPNSLASSPNSLASSPNRAAQEEAAYRHKDSFDFILGSMRKCLNHLGPWSIGDLAFGLKTLADTHERSADDITGERMTNVAVLQALLDDVSIADAIYEKTIDQVVKLCSLRRENIVRFLSDSDRLRPAYCVALRPETKEVLLVVRGTKALGDVVTILTGANTEFQGGYAHAGMLHSAHWLLHNETPKLAELLREHPGYKLHLIGHSLGAGAAALYAMLLREGKGNSHREQLPEGTLPSCTAVAAPACITQDVAVGCGDYITSVVCQNDLVPRACLWAFEELRLEVQQTNWQQDLGNKVIGERLMGLGTTTSDLLAKQYNGIADALAISSNKDSPVNSMLGTLAEVWDSLAENTAKHSDNAKELLSKTSMRIAQLPAGPARKALETIQNLADLRDITQPSNASTPEAARQLPQSPARRILDAVQNVAGLRELTQHLKGPEDNRGQQEGSGGPLSSTAMGHRFQTPSEEAESRAATEKLLQSSEVAVAMASDGEADAELAKLLSDYTEAEESARKTVFSQAPRMFAPGKLIYLRRLSGEGKSGKYEAIQGGEGQAFRRILLTGSMFTDHLCTTYKAALQSAIRELS